MCLRLGIAKVCMFCAFIDETFLRVMFMTDRSLSLADTQLLHIPSVSRLALLRSGRPSLSKFLRR